MIVETLLASFRPGGGDSYSGGGGHGGSGGGGGGGGGAIAELIFQLIRLCVYYPKVGIPILVIVIGFFAWSAYQKNKTKDWDSGPPVELKKAVSLDALREIDPDFSPILFEDFAFRLYATAHEARHDANVLAGLAPYISEGARATLLAREPRGEVTGVVVGAMRTYFVTLPQISSPAPDDNAIVGLELETNYSVAGHTYYAIERWRLTRAGSARTKKRDLAKGFPCPNCGAPWQGDNTQNVQRCSYCNEIVDNGRFDWQVVGIELVHTKQQPPTLTADVPERGTDLPTYRAPDADQRWAELVAADPTQNDQALQARLALIYKELYAAWDKNDLAPARGYLSEGLWDYLVYWTDAYKNQGLRNRMEGMHITRVELAKVTRDRWYDAVTLRIWGTGMDYVVRASTDQLIRGKRNRPRPYSEYWTLIRSATKKGATKTEPVCPNCGAPSKVGMGGACEYCGAHVTTGDFDWVLSKIEQDDSYRG